MHTRLNDANLYKGKTEGFDYTNNRHLSPLFPGLMRSVIEVATKRIKKCIEESVEIRPPFFCIIIKLTMTFSSLKYLTSSRCA